jgi:hypothetical protein
MSHQAAAANVHPVPRMPSANPADTRNDPVPALRREVKLLLVDQRTELEQRRAIEDEIREAKTFILAYVERLEQLCMREAEARKAMEFWRQEAERMAQERPGYLQWVGHYLSEFKSRLIALGLHR